jgi:hypothetical protein
LEPWLTDIVEQIEATLDYARDFAEQLYDPLEHAIRFFTAATPFIYALAMFVALLIILVFFRQQRREQQGAAQTEGEWREKVLDLLDKLSRRIL